MIRAELHAVVQQDYPGLVLQHQGDRLSAIIHLPSGDRFDERCANGLEIAIGMQSSMEHVLNAHLEDRKNIHLAVGLDVGTVLVTRLGKKGERDVICLGPQVTSAEGLQLRSSGQEIRLSKALYDSIHGDAVKHQFPKDAQGAYVARGLTFPKLDEIEEVEEAQEGRLAATATSPRLKIEISSSDRTVSGGSQRAWWSE